MADVVKPPSTRPAWRWVALVLAAVVLGMALYRLEVAAFLRRILDWIDDWGGWGPIAYLGVYIVACIVLMPGTVLTLGAGVLFGFVWGSVYASVGATAGATAAFLLSRYVARGSVTRLIGNDRRFQRLDEAVGREGWKIVGLLRLSPFLPFTLLNYSFGLTQVSLRDYVVASWAGMLPSTILYVYLGVLAGDLANLGLTGRPRTTLEWGLYGVGFVATIAVTVYVTRLARKALAERAH